MKRIIAAGSVAAVLAAVFAVIQRNRNVQED